MSSGAVNITGVLLAGGKSRRMGVDKRFLELGDVTLLQRALSSMERVFSEILIAVAEPTPEISGLGHRVVTDLIPHCASLGGLYTGLFYARQSRVFVAACDMPFLDPRVMKFVMDFDAEADVIMAKLSHGLQPVHAVYSKRCLPYLEAMAKEGNLKVQEIVENRDLSVRLISEDEVRPVDPQFRSFMNINTTADLEFARKLLCGKRSQRTPP